MTRVVSRALQPICTSTALGKDWIPRLTVDAFEEMRDDMARACRFAPTARTVRSLGPGWADCVSFES